MRITKSVSLRALHTFKYQEARVTYTTKAYPPPTTYQTSPSESHVEVPGSPPLLRDVVEEVSDLIDTPKAVSSMIDELYEPSQLYKFPSEPPAFYIDLEGIKLSRFGTIAIMQLHSRPTRRTYLVDIWTLGKAAFTTRGTRSSDTLQSILESNDIPKVFFDVRRDSDALYHHYKIKLGCIHDIQLMELATRTTHRKTLVAGLRQCIEQDSKLPKEEKLEWKVAKETGTNLLAPEKGGKYEVLIQRPLSPEVKAYCIQDVHFLPRLWDVYHRKLRAKWKDRLEKATRARVTESRAEEYQPQGPHMLRGPPGWR